MFDLDDTIVQSGTIVSERVLSTLRAARDAGYALSVSSGRPLCMVTKAIVESGVMDYAVCSNGATVTRLASGERLHSELLSREDAIACYDLLSPFRPAWNGSFGGKAYFEVKGASYMLTGRAGAAARVARREGARRSLPVRLARFTRRGWNFLMRLAFDKSHRQVISILPHLKRATEGVEKIGCTIVGRDSYERAAALVMADGRYEVVRMGQTELEITAKGVSKASGAQALMAAIGMDASRSIAFGDGGNDLPLTRAVGTFVAMGNADDEVKAAADHVCPPVGEDGVAVWIEDHLLSSPA